MKNQKTDCNIYIFNISYIISCIISQIVPCGTSIGVPLAPEVQTTEHNVEHGMNQNVAVFGETSP